MDSRIVLGYGWKRLKKHLLQAGANSAIIDGEDEQVRLRQLRRDMGVSLRPGDTLLLLSIDDLGPGPTGILKCLGDWRISVQIAGHDPILPVTKESRERLQELKADTPYHETKRRRGRPKYFDPTPEQASIVRGIWETEGMMPKHKVKLIGDAMGKPVEYHHVRDWHDREVKLEKMIEKTKAELQIIDDAIKSYQSGSARTHDRDQDRTPEAIEVLKQQKLGLEADLAKCLRRTAEFQDPR